MLCGRVGKGRPVRVVRVETKVFKATEALGEEKHTWLRSPALVTT